MPKLGLLSRLVGVYLLVLTLSFEVFGFPVQLANSPQNSLALTLSAIHSAQKELLINIYEFTEPSIADAILERIQAGVHVELLQEGEPVGGMSQPAQEIKQELVDAMNRAGQQDRYFQMKSPMKFMAKGQKRRFRYDHAKYMVIDGASLVIGSENYSPTGHPLPSENGNRGWEVWVQEPDLAHSFMQMFSEDTNLSYGDVQVLNSSCPFCVPLRTTLYQYLAFHLPRVQNETPWLTVDASLAEKITSPENSLSGLLKIIRGARKTLDIEQMSFHSDWREAKTLSPLFDAVISAAERGVRVRVLLNDENVFFQPPGPAMLKQLKLRPLDQSLRINKNEITVNALNQVARDRGLPLQARIANVKAMGVSKIHNKGVLVDGEKTLISSINWSENSVTNNREAAVLLTSPEAHRYFGDLFQRDWDSSVK